MTTSIASFACDNSYRRAMRHLASHSCDFKREDGCLQLRFDRDIGKCEDILKRFLDANEYDIILEGSLEQIFPALL
jgi:hypothetical protein